jgi:hypothetical protein
MAYNRHHVAPGSSTTTQGIIQGCSVEYREKGCVCRNLGTQGSIEKPKRDNKRQPIRTDERETVSMLFRGRRTDRAAVKLVEQKLLGSSIGARGVAMESEQQALFLLRSWALVGIGVGVEQSGE